MLGGGGRAVLHFGRCDARGVRGGGIGRLREGRLCAERRGRQQQGENEGTGLHIVRSGGSISSVKKKKVARLSSAAFDGSPSARLTNPYTMRAAKQIMAPSPHPAIAFPLSATIRAMANAIIWTTSATIALTSTACLASGSGYRATNTPPASPIATTLASA